MLKFDQTILSDHEKGLYGDCTRAVVYTLAQKNLDLPHPINSKDPSQWNMDFFETLEEKHNLRLDYFPNNEKDHWAKWYLASRYTPSRRLG